MDRRHQGQRRAALSALLWALGLSTRATAALLAGLEVTLSATTVWRDVLLLLQEAKGLLAGRRVPCLGMKRLLGEAPG